MISTWLLAMALTFQVSPVIIDQSPAPVDPSAVSIVYPAGTYVVTIPGSPTITQTATSITFSWTALQSRPARAVR